MNNHQPPSGFLLVAEIFSGGIVAHFLGAIPPWLGGAVTAFVVGLLLRVGDAPARAVSEALRARLVARFPSLSPAPPPSAP